MIERSLLLFAVLLHRPLPLPIIGKAAAAFSTIRIEYAKTMEMLTLLEKRMDMKFDFAEAKKAPAGYAALVATPRINEEIYIRRPKNQFSERIWIDADRNFDPVRLAVTISSGPY